MITWVGQSTAQNAAKAMSVCCGRELLPSSGLSMPLAMATAGWVNNSSASCWIENGHNVVF